MYYSKSIFAVLFLIIILGSCTKNNSNSQTNTDTIVPLNGKEAFIAWGKKNALTFDSKNKALPDSILRRIAEDIADSKVVLLSEGFHNCEEMLQLQSQLIPYLVTNKGFNTVVVESGFPESKYMNDYIHSKDTIPNLWERSVDILYTKWKMGRKTIEFLRAHNQLGGSKVDYIGADIGGFYNDWQFPFQQIFAYIDSVDASLSQSLKKDMAPYFKIMTKYAAYHYTIKLSSTQKNKLAVILEELMRTFESNKTLYISKSNPTDYLWILQCVKSMAMAENYYRNHADAKDTINDHSKYVGTNGREIAMAKNIQWILTNKTDAKIIVVNHVIHTKTESQYQGEFYGHFTPMGQLLKQQLKDGLYAIGMVYGGGHFWNNWQSPSRRFMDTIPTPASGNIEPVMQAISTQDYYINLENTPAATHSWFKENTMLRENDYEIKMKLSEWNACFFLNEVGPAEPVNPIEPTEPPYEG
jgi:erythromycin esterase-like protein